MKTVFGPRGVGRAALLAIIGLACAGIAAREAAVQALARSNPDLVLRLDPTNPDALDARFSQSLAREGTNIPMAGWAARARAALVEMPLDAHMLRMAAVDPARHNDNRLLRLAEQVSRRDPLLQLALIEISVNAGQIKPALVHYDRALSVYPDLRPVLFPVLAKAIEEPGIRDALVVLARDGRPWMADFVGYAVRQGPFPGATAALLTRIDRGPGALAIAGDEEAALAARLVGQGDYADARGLARRALGRDSDAIDRVGFEPATWLARARPLTWTLVETEGVDAKLGEGNAATVTAGPGNSGLALYRMLVVPPGTYRFTAVATPSADGLAALKGHWSILCMHRGQVAATSLADLRMEPGRPAVITAVTVGGGCAAVRLGFSVDNIDNGENAATTLRVGFMPLH